jgi:hypothetical protein
MGSDGILAYKTKCDMLTLAGIVLAGLTAVVAYMKWSNNCDC